MNESPTDTISIRGEEVERVSEFVYLGSLLTEDGKCGKEINRRIGLGAARFQQLKKSVWDQPGISLKTKVSIYRSTVLSTVLYGAESWTCTPSEYAKLNAFNTRRLRSLVGRKSTEIHNKDLYKMTDMPSLENMVRKYRLRWAGHVRRMDDYRLPKKMLFGRVVEGKQRSERPVLDWMDCMKNDWDLVKPQLHLVKWETQSKDKNSWRKTLSSLTSD